ncbi:MAG TPA: class I SAM-dependent methyltransferase [Rhizomicrobium sp.]|nr:class I SAM-dependent methyltransferase [Rhizomicrobium sp.]
MGETGRCALCGSGEREVVQSQSLALLSREEPCRIDFGVCRTCGHIQQWPPVAADVMAYHYRSFATYEVFGDAERLRAAPPSRHAKRFLSLVADMGLAPGHAYEVGCACGDMLHQFRNLGWQVGGCDPSPSAIAQAASIFGIAVDLGSEEETVRHQKNLDVIFLCHVLEHLYDPRAALARFQAALAPGGHLILEVPCAVAPDQLPPGWFTFEHLHYYRPEILEKLLQAAGFAVVAKRIEMTAEHYPVIAIAARKVRVSGQTDAPSAPSGGMDLAHRYAARDEKQWAATAARVARVQGPVFVYGAGIHTAQLLDRTSLTARILAIADRDPKKWGQTQAGRPIISPQDLFSHPAQAPVIISSYVSEKAILETLCESGIAPARFVPLYCDWPTASLAAAG